MKSTRLEWINLYQMVDDLGFEFAPTYSSLSLFEISFMAYLIFHLVDSSFGFYKFFTHKKLALTDELFVTNGGRYRIRTYDPLRVKQVL